MREKNDGWLRRQIEQHWFTATLAAVLMLTGFRDTDTEMKNDIKAVKEDVRIMKHQKAALSCAVRTIDRLADRSQIEMPCELNTPE